MKRFIAILAAITALAGCIQNDLPYPTVPAVIERMSVEGAREVAIDEAERMVSIVLEEPVDIRKVHITDVVFGGREVSSSIPLKGTHDLSEPMKVTLTNYHDYEWVISAEQPIERRFTISGQMGEADIDAANRRILVQVSSSVELDNLNIEDIKLGPEGISTISPDPGVVHDFSDMVTLKLSCHGRSEDWNIFVEQSESSVQVTSVNAWARLAYVKATGIDGADCGFRYRRKGDSDWIAVDSVSVEGAEFSGVLKPLEPECEYECTAWSGSDESPVRSFTTETEQHIPNGGFELFSNAESDKYCSFYDPSSSDPALSSKWWCSGNKGSTTVGSSYAITMPDANEHVEGSYSVKLASAYVVVKFAAGNIFSGEFGRTIGTSGGTVRMGRPFTGRPRKLSVWLKYRSGEIPAKCIGGYPEGDAVNAGDRDRGIVWIALGCWDYHKYGGTEQCPVEINTTDKSTFFDSTGPDVIAYGSHVMNSDTDGWVKVEIPLTYTSVSRKPTHIIISGAASMLGDYFTGSPDSILWIDDMKLEY